MNADPLDASFADLYLGEDVTTRQSVDASRLQKLIMTILLVTLRSDAVVGVRRRLGDYHAFSMPIVGTKFFLGMMGVEPRGLSARQGRSQELGANYRARAIRAAGLRRQESCWVGAGQFRRSWRCRRSGSGKDYILAILVLRLEKPLAWSFRRCRGSRPRSGTCNPR